MKRFILSVLLVTLSVAILTGCENRVDHVHKQITAEKIRADLEKQKVTYLNDEFVIDIPAYVKLRGFDLNEDHVAAVVDIKALNLGQSKGIKGTLKLSYVYGSSQWQMREVAVVDMQELGTNYVKRLLQLVDYPLHFAANIGDYALVKKALRKRAAVNQPEEVKLSTALMFASERGALDIVKLLVANGAEVNYANRDSLTPLLAASYGNHLEIVTFLLGKGADINAADRKGKTALTYAASRDALDVAKYLVKQGVDVNAHSKGGRPALFAAAKSNSASVAKFLIDQGAEVAFQEGDMVYSPLLSAAYYNSVEVVELLLEAGAKTSGALSGFHRGSKVFSALELAEQNGYGEVVELLKKAETQ